MTFNSPLTERTTDSMLSSFGQKRDASSSSANNNQNDNSSARTRENVVLGFYFVLELPSPCFFLDSGKDPRLYICVCIPSLHLDL